MKVLLVNPPPWRVLEPEYDAPRFPRQGLACLAAALRARGGFEIGIVDAKLERLDFEGTLRRIRAFGPDVVGLTAFTNEIKPAARVAALVKSALPRTLTVIGGVHVTALPRRTLEEFPQFDLGCVGEGELTLPELCAAVAAGGPLASIPGLVVRAGADIIETEPRPKIVDWDAMPHAAYDLFPRADEYYVMTQRGCPFTCKFCFNPNGRTARQRGVADVLAEIEEILDRYRPRELSFADELFSVNMDRTHELLDGLIRIGVPKRTRFWVQTHVNFVDEPLLRKLKQAGCYSCGLGIETGDDAALRAMGKGSSRGMIGEAFGAARRAGLDVMAFFVLGHPDETVASIQNTIDLAAELNPKLPLFGVMVPYPGTEVARLAARQEAGYRLVSSDWDDFNKQLGGALEFAGLERWQIERRQLAGYLTVFLRNGRFLDLAAFIWKYRTSGFRLAAKIVSGFAGSRRGRREIPRPPSRAIREALEAAFARWERLQTRGLRQTRRDAAPGLIRVIGRQRAGSRDSGPPIPNR